MQRRTWHSIAVWAVVAGSVAGCDAATTASNGAGGGSIVGQVAIHTNRDTSVIANVGQEVDITLVTVGPGQFDDPSVAIGPVQFVSSAIVAPYVPAGPRQQFRFAATAPGQTVVVFHHAQGDTYPFTPADVADTIIVR